LEKILKSTVKVLLLTQWFDPEPTFKGMVFARELVRQGFEVEVLTGFPNYPSGKIYPGYAVKWIQKELIDGVQVTRVPLYASHDSSAMKRIANYGSFACSALIYGLFCAKKIDVIYAYHPPLTTGLTATLLRLIRRVPVVYDIQDMWPDTLRATGMLNSESALGVISKVCDWVYARLDHLVVLSPGFQRLLIERGVPHSKITVIYNWADVQALAKKTPLIDSTLIDSAKFNVVFAGNMGKAQALDSVLKAALIVSKVDLNVQFVFIGAGLELEHLKSHAAELGLTNICFIPPVSMIEVGGFLRKADVLLVHLKADPLFEITIPSKTQAYMSVGKPLLMAVNGDAADLLRESGAGVVVSSQDESALANAILGLAKLPKAELVAMGDNASNYYSQHLSVEVGVGKFAKIFRKIGKKDFIK
jgi:colanic acid biosynthesis glycosyl transferase WcaI